MTIEWEQRWSDAEKQFYYFNPKTEQSEWNLPDDGRVSTSPPVKVRAAHILVKHTMSRRPSSWKTATIIISKNDAIRKLEKFRESLQGLTGSALVLKFQEIARTESDCASAKKGGDLGIFGKGEMQSAFENESFNLHVGEMSGIVDTESGIHLILRLE